MTPKRVDFYSTALREYVAVTGCRSRSFCENQLAWLFRSYGMYGMDLREGVTMVRGITLEHTAGVLPMNSICIYTQVSMSQ